MRNGLGYMAATLALTAWLGTGGTAQSTTLDELLSGVVYIKTFITPDGRTTENLGREREGTGAKSRIGRKKPAPAPKAWPPSGRSRGGARLVKQRWRQCRPTDEKAKARSVMRHCKLAEILFGRNLRFGGARA